MASFIRIFLILFLGLAALNCGKATPPIAGPNVNLPDPGQDGGVLVTDHDTLSIPLPSSPSLPLPTDDGIEESQETIEFPDAIISSKNSAFATKNPVQVGVRLAAGFAGNAPMVGPDDFAITGQLSIQIEVLADASGNIRFGVYISPITTPGTYEFFARQDSRLLTITLEMIQP